VADGGSETKWEYLDNTRCLRGNYGSPQASRDTGIRAARNDTVLVLEDHVVVSDIAELVSEHRRLESTLTFPIRASETNEMFDVYGCEVDWEKTLWYKKLLYNPPEDRPYPVAQFGNSCFVLDRRWYLESGGYTNLMTGWGAEEPFICLKAWALGKSCWMVPHVWHAHYLTPGAHMATLASANYKRNFDILAYVIAGRRNPGFVPDEPIEAERRRIVAGPFGGDVEKLREFFKQHGVVN
jgi:hypothetical protein